MVVAGIAIFSKTINEFFISNYHNSLANYRSIIDAITFNIPV